MRLLELEVALELGAARLERARLGLLVLGRARQRAREALGAALGRAALRLALLDRRLEARRARLGAEPRDDRLLQLLAHACRLGVQLALLVLRALERGVRLGDARVQPLERRAVRGVALAARALVARALLERGRVRRVGLRLQEAETVSERGNVLTRERRERGSVVSLAP